ncbi:MAG: glycoside hydrolase family 13 protein [Paenibacillus sp.]|uniref:glycoside hydrolase family 13 protein n=1 Tax=Paenibacillus sp. TaxID=58172 RepID=UPI002911CB08|nr:glycoside hydrolase family 13 protein [Paenibacillus sp.]MDU4697226.1 glycoside hydrolase family 13 protein [Paenibacillus sp.]
MTQYLYHDPVVDATLISLNELEVRLKLPADANQVTLNYWNKYKPEYGIRKQAMTLWAESEGFKFYRTILTGMESRIRYLQYKFEFDAKGESYWLGAEGLRKTEGAKGSYSYAYAGDRDRVNSPDWIGNRVWYQIFPERFCNGDPGNDPESVEPWGSVPTRDNYMGGDLQGIIKQLDYLSGLGINALYLNPIFAATSNHKYDTVDYLQIDPQFGTVQDLQELVQKCHERDIKVILDLVINHCGFYHPYFQDVVQKGEASDYKDWFYINRYPIHRSEDGYDSVGYYQWMPKLRTSNPEVQQYVYDIVSFWQKETGIDGWRIDVADEVEISFLRELKSCVKKLNPNAIIIAEIWDDAKRLMASGGVDSVMNYELRTILFDYCLDRSIPLAEFHSRLVSFLHRYSLTELDQMFNLLGSHDTERILTCCGKDESKLQQLLALQFFLPGNPTVYYGDELGMTGENDPGCRGSLPWELVSSEPPLLREFQTWIQRKTTAPVLHHGNTELRYREDSECYVIRRYTETEEAVLLINFSPDRQDLNSVMKRFDLIGSYSMNHSQQDSGNLPEFIGPGETILFQKRD